MNLSITNHVKSASAGSDSVCFSGATLAVASNTIPPGIRMNTEIPLFGCFILLVALEFAPGQSLRLDQGFLFGSGIGFYAFNAKSKFAIYAQKAMRMTSM